MNREEIDELVELVKFDYQHSMAFIDGVVRVSIGLRTIAMAGCLALLAAAMQVDQPFLAFFAFLAAAALGAQDAYHGWLYAEARDHVRKMEDLIGSYYRLVQGKASTAREAELLKQLRKHRIGAKPILEGPGPSRSRARQAVWRGETTSAAKAAAALRIGWLFNSSRTVIAKARPRIVYLLLYPLLALISVAIAAVLLAGDGNGNADGRPLQICVACETGSSAGVGWLTPPDADRE